jgi:4-amino-4-deoxychorismate lyase
MQYLILNNDLIEYNDFKVNADNRAFNFGDGLFETLKLKKGKVLFLNDHYERLTEGMKVFSMDIPGGFTPGFLEKQMAELADKNNLGEEARIKLLVWRKPGGKFVPTDNGVEYTITASDFIKAPEFKNKAFFYNHFRASHSPVSKFKTCSAVQYVLAGLAAQSKRADEMILLDVNFKISECISSNIFWVKGKEIFTPSLDTGCIDGIMRKQIIERGKNFGLQIVEGKFDKQKLLEADYAFTSNITGLSLLKQLENTAFNHSNLKIYEEINALIF